jgi:FKBP-type peptidyl-prolyl cis-trans isomerase
VRTQRESRYRELLDAETAAASRKRAEEATRKQREAEEEEKRAKEKEQEKKKEQEKRKVKEKEVEAGPSGSAKGKAKEVIKTPKKTMPKKVSHRYFRSGFTDGLVVQT